MNNNIEDMLSSFENVCYSGGAAGADRLFGLFAISMNHSLLHFSFNEHNANCDEEYEFKLPQNFLSAENVQQALRTANRTLGRKVPSPKTYTGKLLARNYYQIISTERVYCIADLESPTRVKGGTSWAVQMYIDRTDNAEVYVYSPSDDIVYQYDNNIKQFIIVLDIPTPYGRWTGIGSRNATEHHMKRLKTFFR